MFSKIYSRTFLFKKKQFLLIKVTKRMKIFIHENETTKQKISNDKRQLSNIRGNLTNLMIIKFELNKEKERFAIIKCVKQQH